MSRRRRARRDAVTLFPFLSVLVCVIGALALTIAATLASGADPAEVLREIETRIQIARQAVERLRASLHEARRTELALEEARRRGGELDAQIGEGERHRKLKANRDRILDELAASASALRAATDARERLAAAIAQKERSQVRVLPSGSGVGLAPFFVECRERALIPYDEDGTRLGAIAVDEIDASVMFEKLVADVRSRPNGILILLVRSDGVTTYKSVASYLDGLGTRNAKLPIAGYGPLDLSAVR